MYNTRHKTEARDQSGAIQRPKVDTGGRPGCGARRGSDARCARLHTKFLITYLMYNMADVSTTLGRLTLASSPFWETLLEIKLVSVLALLKASKLGSTSLVGIILSKAPQGRMEGKLASS